MKRIVTFELSFVLVVYEGIPFAYIFIVRNSSGAISAYVFIMTSTAYAEYQQLLYPIARNMLGNTSDAEDLVQETLFKWLSLAKKDIQNVRGYLVKTLVNKCLNFIRDRKRESGKEVEVAPELLKDHLPAWIEHAHGLSLGMLALLEKLSATERAVFLLKEVFGYSHKEIAELLGISEENCRQILARAKKHLKKDKQRFVADPDHHLELYQSFVQVLQGGDLGKLLEILREDIHVDIMRPAASLQGNMAAATYLLQLLPSSAQFHLYLYKGLPLLTIYLLGKPFLRLTLWGNGEQIQGIEIRPLKKREKIAPEIIVH